MENFIKLLKCEGKTIIKRYGGVSEEINLYSFKIKPCQERYSYNLPPWLGKYIENALYALPDKAVKTITFLFEEAVRFDSRDDMFRGYDTSVRDELYSISNIIINKAIYLLTDYYFDPETNYYVSPQNRMIDRNTLKKLLTYQLWAGRTGRGLQKYYASINQYDDYYNGPTYYQNDFWLKRLLDNEEIIQENSFQKRGIGYIADEDTELIPAEGPVIHEDRTSCSRYDVTFMFYQKQTIEAPNFIVIDFEDNFSDDIPERRTWKYKVVNYTEPSALRLALNTLFYDLFGDTHKYDLNPITNLKYKIQHIKVNHGVYEQSISLLKK